MLHRNIVWSLIAAEHNCRNTFTVIGKIIGRLLLTANMITAEPMRYCTAPFVNETIHGWHIPASVQAGLRLIPSTISSCSVPWMTQSCSTTNGHWAPTSNVFLSLDLRIR